MSQFRKFFVSPQATIFETVRLIDAAGQGIALVVDENDILQGTVTDGDIRRGILKGIPLEGPVSDVMNRKPTTASAGDPLPKVFETLKALDLRHMPVIDENRKVVGIEILDGAPESLMNEASAVIMAGGFGKRLGEITKSIPKPLLPIGDQPILEIIVRRFISVGVTKLYLSVNYKAEMIKEHFGDGSNFGAEIKYVHESEPLGTAGALGLIQSGELKNPFFVMNGDVLTNVDLASLMEFHLKQESEATMCVRQFDFQVPYGVVNINGEKILGIDEKPIQKFFVNAGIYLMNPSILELIPASKHLDMPTLFELIASKGKKTLAFPVREYWMDVGRPTDFEKANGDYSEVFKGKEKT